MNTIYKQSSLMHVLLIVRERGAIFYNVQKHSSGEPLESERGCRFPRPNLPKSAKTARRLPRPSPVPFFARGADPRRGEARGAVPSANTRDRRWGPPAPRVTAPRGTTRVGSNPGSPPHRPVGGGGGCTEAPGPRGVGWGVVGSWLPTGYERGREGRFGGEGPCPSFLGGMRGWVFYTLKNKPLLRPINARFSVAPTHPNGSPWARTRPQVGASTVPAVGAAGTRRPSGTGTWGQKVSEPQFPVSASAGKEGSVPARPLRGFARIGPK